MEVGKIKRLLLDSVGNPESGAIAEYADVMAKAIAEGLEDKLEVKSYEPVKETRVVKPTESR